MVYFLHNPRARALKIGMAANPERRRQALQVASPDKIRILGVIPGDVQMEGRLHHRFAAARIRGEWFRATGDMLGEVRRLVAEFGIPTADRHFPFRPTSAGWEGYRQAVAPMERRAGQMIGFPVSVYWGKEPFMTGAVDRRFSYQVMPRDDSGPQAAPRGFWGWHLDANPQWFGHPEDAAESFIRAFRLWQSTN